MTTASFGSVSARRSGKAVTLYWWSCAVFLEAYHDRIPERAEVVHFSCLLSQDLTPKAAQNTHFGLYAVHLSRCLSIGRVVSGDAPPGSDPASLQSPNILAPIGAGTLTTQLYRQTVSPSATLNLFFHNSLVGLTGEPADRMLMAFNENCPDLLALNPANFSTPQENLAYACSKQCVGWMINFGVCAATELKEVRFGPCSSIGRFSPL
jgi:hypothetical protein